MAMTGVWLRVVTILGLLLLAAGALIWLRQEMQPLPAIVSPEGLSAPSPSRVGTSALSHGGSAPEPVRKPSQGANRPGSSGEQAP